MERESVRLTTSGTSGNEGEDELPVTQFDYLKASHDFSSDEET